MRYRVYRQRRRIPPLHAQTVTIGIAATAEAPISAAALDTGDPLAIYGPYTRMTLGAYRRYSVQVADALGIPTKYGNQRAEPPNSSVTELWAHAQVRHEATEYISGRRQKYRKQGYLDVQIYSPKKKGTKAALVAAQGVVEAFRSDTDTWNEWLTPEVSTVGAFSAAGRGGWWRVDVSCPFYADDSDRVYSQTYGSPTAGVEDATSVIRQKMIGVAAAYPVTLITENAPDKARSVDEQWVSLQIATVPTVRPFAGPAGNFRIPGVATAQVFSPLANGEKAGLQLVDFIAVRFRSVGDQGVKFLTPYLQTVGRQGAWWQDNLLIPFEAEEAS